MLEKLFLWFTTFFGILSIFGIYLGYFHLIYANLSFIAIILSGIISYLIVRRCRGVEVRHSRHIFLILLFLLVLDFYVTFPYLIYPHSYVDFGLNVAQGRLIAQTHGFPSFVHVYPNVYYGVFAIFDSLVPHAYSVSTIIAIVMQAMTVLAIFFIGKSVFDEKVGIVAAFLYSFSFVNILLLEQGYLTQNFATFFFVSAMYLAIMVYRERSYCMPLIFSLAGLVSYPHYFALIIVVIFLYFRKLFGFLFLALVLLAPEIVGMILFYLTHLQIISNSFVMNGGILVPNLFILSIFLPAIPAFLDVLRKNKSMSILSFVYVIGGIIALFGAIFLINMFIYSWRTPSILQLYTAIKLLYLFFVPVSLFAAYFIRKNMSRYHVLAIVFAGLYFAFYANYMLILNEKNNLPNEIYYSSEFLSDLNANYNVGFDYGLLQQSWEEPFIYDTLYGKKDNYTVFSSYELGFLLQSNWKKSENGDYRSGSYLNISYVMDGSDFFVTLSDLDGDVYYSFGKLRVYKLRK